MENDFLDELRANQPIKSDTMVAHSFSKYNVPKFIESPGKDWIQSGSDNLFPQYLVDMFGKSSTHNSIILIKQKQIAGEGWSIDDTADADQSAALKQFISRPNKRESLNAILSKVALDQQLFGYWTLGIKWSDCRTKIESVYHIDAAKIRIGKPDDDSEEYIESDYWYSDDWSKYRKPKFTPERIARFSPSNRIDQFQLLLVKKYTPGLNFYCFPDYQPCLNAIELQYELSNLQLNSIKNGLSPSLLISMNSGAPSAEQQDVNYKAFNNLYRGSDNAGKFILFYNKDKSSEPTITPLETSNLHQLYGELSNSIRDQIIEGHRIPKILASVNSPGELGASNEIAQEQERFYNTVIAPEQVEIENVINELLHINGFSVKLYIKDLQPISFQYNEATLLQILTVDEMRKKLGYAPLSESDRQELYSRNKIEKQPRVPSTHTAMESEPSAPVNDNIKNLSAKQHQQMLRVIRQVSKGQLTREAGSVLLSTGLGLNSDDINALLPEVEDEMDAVKPYTDQTDDKLTHKKLLK